MKAKEEIYNILNYANLILEKNQVPLSYIIKKSKSKKNITLQAIHDLLSEDRIESVYVSQCPLCYQNNNVDLNSKFVECSRCGEKYRYEDYHEEYKLK